jgi:hypothetical protein
MRLTEREESVRTKDLFSIDWVKSVGITNEMVPTVKKRGWERKQILCKNVFNTFFQIMIDDVIDNDVVFIAPVTPSFKVYMKHMNETQMQRIFNNPGIYGDVDFIKTNGRVYSLRLTLPYAKANRNKEIRINYKDYKRIVKRANDGYIYCGVKDVRQNRYIDLMKEEFPTLNETIIKKITIKGCFELVNAIVYNRPVMLVNNEIKFRAYIYHPAWKLLKAMAEK